MSDETQARILNLLDVLAVEVGEHRRETRRGFERVEHRLDNVEHRLGNLETRVESFETFARSTDRRLDDHDRRIRALG